MKAMILAAGYGLRLRPLTDVRPKPLVPVLNKPLIMYTLELLKRNGINEAVINIHHMMNRIVDDVGNGREFGMSITYSKEPQILGTGGAIKKVEEYFAGDDFLVINSDILIDINLKELIAYHKTSEAFATMVLRSDLNSANYGEIAINKKNQITGFLGKGSGREKLMFTGLHVISPKVFQYLSPGVPSCIINDFYLRAFKEEKKLMGYVYKGFWSDLGTIKTYFLTSIDLLRKKFLYDSENQLIGNGIKAHDFPKIIHPVLIGNNVRIKENCVIGPNVIIGNSCVIKENTNISNSIIWDHVAVGPNVTLDNVIKNAKLEVIV